MANKRQSGWKYAAREHDEGRPIERLLDEAKRLPNNSEFKVGMLGYINTALAQKDKEPSQ